MSECVDCFAPVAEGEELCPNCTYHDCFLCGGPGRYSGEYPGICWSCWDKEHPETFVNVYLVGRSYGGPEEGGWWYDWGICEETIDCVNEGLAKVVAAVKQHQIDEDWNVGRSTNVGSVVHTGHYEVYVERQRGKSYPDRTPRYE